MTSQIRRIGPALIFFCLPLLAGAADSDFPQPQEIDRDVGFWLRIFSDVSTDQGLLHDNRNLAVVYEVMPMPENTGRRSRNRKVAARRKHYQGILRKLAGGDRQSLNDDEQRVLSLWPENVSNAELTAAAGQIRFQHGLADRFAEGLVRAGRWRAHVNEAFSRHGVPLELAALPHVESSYNPAARSHVGASGIWQFTRGTGRRFMRVDHVLDERNDPFLATEAAAKLLAYNYSITGNWPMAITAYNHGLAGVRRAMRKHGDTAYADILRNYRGRAFGFASRNFYVAFLAAKTIDQDPDKYFPQVTPEAPESFAVFQLNDYIPAEDVIELFGMSQREFARYNPALQPTVWTGSKYIPRDFELRVPSRQVDTSVDELLASLGEAQRFETQLPDLFHTIARGDSLSRIAEEYDTTVATLVALNGLRSRHRIRAGQQLRLPAAGPAPAVVAVAETPAEPEITESVPEPSTAMLADAPALPGAPEAPTVADSEDAPVDDLLGDADEGTPQSVSLQSALRSDPSDYTVGSDLTIEVHPLETLGHYADWLQIRTQRLRDLNGLAFRTPVEVGRRIELDTSKVSVADFERLRAEYHRQQQDNFFRHNTISGVREHVVARGESLWILSLRQYDVPIWLFRQYNPEIDMHRVTTGTRVRFPMLDSNTG